MVSMHYLPIDYVRSGNLILDYIEHLLYWIVLWSIRWESDCSDTSDLQDMHHLLGEMDSSVVENEDELLPILKPTSTFLLLEFVDQCQQEQHYFSCPIGSVS